MTKPTLYDNDAVLKLSAYQCWDWIASTALYPPAILKVATFSLPRQARKARRVMSPETFRAALSDFLRACEVIEPSPEEIALATELEEQALAAGEEFDTGESQLVAVLTTRLLPRLVSGDKRAMKALAALGVSVVYGRILCLEQVLAIIMEQGCWAELREQVCAERDMDRAVSTAFSCHHKSDEPALLAALSSYVESLRSLAPRVLTA